MLYTMYNNYEDVMKIIMNMIVMEGMSSTLIQESAQGDSGGALQGPGGAPRHLSAIHAQFPPETETQLHNRHR